MDHTAGSACLQAPAYPQGERRRRSVDPVGGEDGFADVVAREHHGALRLARRLTADHHEAGDSVAEALASTYAQWQAGRIDAVGPYLRQAVRNQVKNQRRSQARQRRHEQRHSAADGAATATADEVADRETVLGLLARLPLRQRAAVVLRYYEDCSYADIAEALGCRLGTVKSLLSRALATLRTHATAAELSSKGGSTPTTCPSGSCPWAEPSLP